MCTVDGIGLHNHCSNTKEKSHHSVSTYKRRTKRVSMITLKHGKGLSWLKETNIPYEETEGHIGMSNSSYPLRP